MYLYSNISGAHIIDKEVKESFLYKNEDDMLESCEKLSKGEYTEAEKSLLKKHPSAIIINRKTDRKPAGNEETINTLSIFRKETSELQEKAVIIAKNSVKKSFSRDLLVIQASNDIEELQKSANLISRRLREWYELHNPEVSRAISGNEKFAEIIVSKGTDELRKMYEVKYTMGAGFEQEDLDAVLKLAQMLNDIYGLVQKQEKYLEALLKEIAPNMQAVAGTLLASKLIAAAGSIRRIAMMPASTIQLLGAEKALFRHIRTGAKSPKHGMIIQHPFVANSREKGKSARKLADKISIASRIDFFGGEFIGEKLKNDLGG